MSQCLTDLERLAKYRWMADHAHDSARAANSLETKNAFASLAMSWETLILELERMFEAEAHSSDGFDQHINLPLWKQIDPVL